MISSDNAVVVNYPNQIGDCGRYELSDQRKYFSRFEGGASYIFQLALQNVVAGDLLNYAHLCNEIFDMYYEMRFAENTVTMTNYHCEHREFNRRIIDIYRFAKSSLACLGETEFSKVKMLMHNRNFDTASFLLS